MWTVEIVKARFIEACDVEHRMMVKGMPGSGNAWPAYRFDEADMSGWDDQARLDHLELWQGRKVTKSPEISRWEEAVFVWTAMIPESRRFLVWRWAQCKSAGRSFSKWCEDHGIVRMTAYNRLDKVFAMLVSRFSKDAILLRMPDPKWCLHEAPIIGTDDPMIEEAAPKRYAVIHPKSWQAEKSTDLLQTAEDFAAFEQHMTDVNEQRRKLRLRKALRGVPGEVEAA